MINECRPRTQSWLKQENIATIALRIQDAGTRGELAVSPFVLQKGARTVKELYKLQHVRPGAKSASSDYIIKFLNQILADGA